jgi:hypothetical protein
MESNPMPRFFARVRTATSLVPDEKGFELATLGKIHAEVARLAKDLVASDPSAVTWTFEIADEEGRTVLTLPLKDCL